jgi:hypothetical protein
MQPHDVDQIERDVSLQLEELDIVDESEYHFEVSLPGFVTCIVRLLIIYYVQVERRNLRSGLSSSFSQVRRCFASPSLTKTNYCCSGVVERRVLRSLVRVRSFAEEGGRCYHLLP